MSATVKVNSSLSDDIAPDVINVSIAIEGVGNTKQDAIKEYNSRHDALLGSLVAAGVREEEITTSRLWLSSEWRATSYRGKKTRRRTGRYEFAASVECSIPCEEGIYEKVWEAILALDFSGISTDLEYDLKDYEGARETIMRRAVAAGRKRAALLADAAGCDLGQVVHIENALRGNSYYDRDFATGGGATGNVPDELEVPTFSPSPVHVDCEITLEYELVPRQ